MVRIKECAPYTVPAGKILVVTELGQTEDTAHLGKLTVGGRVELIAKSSGVASDVGSLRPVAPCPRRSPGVAIDLPPQTSMD
jgi:hypothetical protein